MLTIIDYGIGNLRSLCNAFAELGVDVTVTGEAASIRRADKIILPGVGAIAPAIETLNSLGIADILRERVATGVPLLGICLGMQLITKRSWEDGKHDALGWIDAECRRFDSSQDLKVPHIGWNELVAAKDHPLIKGIESGSDVYFVHSYFVDCANQDDVIATSTYGIPFAAICGSGHVMGVQFHPEKSQEVGLRILKNFVDL